MRTLNHYFRIDGMNYSKNSSSPSELSETTCYQLFVYVHDGLETKRDCPYLFVQHIGRNSAQIVKGVKLIWVNSTV